MTIDANLFAEVDKLFEAYDKPGVPGCALAIIHESEIVYKRGYGLANLEYDILITPSTVFDIASVSKQFTAACALLLELQGKLRLEDDIHKYLPELNYKQPITLLNLIHHTSGIPDYLVLMGFAGSRFTTTIPQDN
jgi:CubicO group peptidase (beta-lactamase class C family)